MPDETKLIDKVKMLEKQVQKHQQEIDSLHKEIERLYKGLEVTEADGLEELLRPEEILEFGTLGHERIKGKIKWMNDYLICVATTGDDEPPTEVFVFKHVLTYIRKPEQKSVSRRGMYV